MYDRWSKRGKVGDQATTESGRVARRVIAAAIVPLVMGFAAPACAQVVEAGSSAPLPHASMLRPSSVRIGPAELAADVALLRRALETLHPGLLRYNTRAALDSHFAELGRRLSREQTVGEAFVAFSRFTTALRCGHTYPNYWNQPRALRADLLEGPDKLPFTYRVVEGRMLVERSAVPDSGGAGGIRRGDEVLAINGVPTREIVSTLVRLVRADGHNDAKRRSLAELRGLQRYEAADAFVPLLHPPSPGSEGQLRYTIAVAREGRHRDVAVDAIRAADRNARALPLPAEPLPAGAPWSWRVEGAVGILRTDAFVGKARDGTHPWRDFLTRTFADARERGLPRLVVDLRENEGGIDDDALLLLQHLSARPMRLPAYRQVVQYEVVPADLRPYLDTWNPAFYDRRGRAERLADGTYRRLAGGPPTEVSPAPNAFGGRVVLLVGPVASSASHSLTRAAQAAGVATVVGEPTGGNLRGSTGGELFFFKMPNSGIEIDIPLVASYVAGDWPPTGVMPDVPIAPTVADFRAGRDVALERAMQVAASR